MVDIRGGEFFPSYRRLAYGAFMRRIAFSLVVACAAYFAQPLWRATQGAVADTRAKQTSISFAPGELPADRDGASLLNVPAPGRYSIRAKSPLGRAHRTRRHDRGPARFKRRAGPARWTN